MSTSTGMASALVQASPAQDVCMRACQGTRLCSFQWLFSYDSSKKNKHMHSATACADLFQWLLSYGSSKVNKHMHTVLQHVPIASS